jgi:hypothetical protein
MARLGLFISSPQVIFATHNISFSIFLFLFAKLCLLHFGLRPEWNEWCLAFWVFTFFTEEMRQILEYTQAETQSKDKKTKANNQFWHYLGRAISEWFSDTWNKQEG